jgi:hypothetical protein
VTKTTWKIINEGMGSSKMKIRNEKKNYEIQSLKVNAENFNDHFINIAINITDKIKHDNISSNHTTSYSPYNLSKMYNLKFDSIIFRNTSSGEIESIIKKLPSKGSYGYDEISTKILQISATFISSPLCNIINKSLSSSKF